MEKYRLRNLDCADCALKIETGLKKLDSVNFASINFATAQLRIDTENIEEAEKLIKDLEPEVELVGQTAHSHEQDEDLNLKTELIRLGLLLASFAGGLIFIDKLEATPFHLGEWVVFLAVYLFSGWKVLRAAGRNILKGRIFDENFLMAIATIGAMFIHALPEAAGVMIFFTVGEFFEDLALARSRKSIKALMEIRPDSARILKDGEYVDISPEGVKTGSTILVKPGERVPLDGEVISGDSQVDTSALTGESVPRTINKGSVILAGMVLLSGSLTIKTTKTFANSSLSRILELVEDALQKKAKTEKFITTFARYYTPIIVFSALGIALLPPLLVPGALFSTWIYRALVILVISCPCALVISIPLGYFGGIGGASRKGILIKGSNYIDILAKVKTVVFDKTGTLTTGTFEVTEINPRNGFSRDDIIKTAALAEAHSNHPVALSIKKAWGGEVRESDVTSHEDIPGYGIKAIIDGKTILVGNDRLLHRENIKHTDCEIAATVAYVVIDSVYSGYIIISDRIKEDSAKALRELKKLGIQKTVMLTGDNEKTAKSVAAEIGIDEYYAELLPDDKVKKLTEIISANNGYTAFVGDGINDAPVIALADAGIAMGELGSDAAIETADIVLMTDAPSKIAQAVKISRKTRTIVIQNITIALVIKLVFVGLGIAGLAGMWEAVFADVGVALIAIFNALRVLK
ncbi:MAG: cadmium-translocating P-type ATPase [Spirochaetales bacterium]|nr:cadmium-translocating P-type ATPase [Spirochaetales bacterium]